MIKWSSLNKLKAKRNSKKFGGNRFFFYLCACVSTSYNGCELKCAGKTVRDYGAVTLYGMASTAIMLSGNY